MKSVKSSVARTRVNDELLLHFTHGDLVLDLCSGEPWCTALDNESVDLVVDAIFSPHDHHVRVRPVADPTLFTVQHPPCLALTAAKISHTGIGDTWHTHAFTCGVAVICRFDASLPALGSVSPKHPISSRLANLGKYFCFCSSLPI